MIKRIYTATLYLLFTLCSFAIDPHGARVDHYDRGYNHSGSGGAGIFILLVIIAGGIILLLIFSNSNKKNVASSSTYNPYTDWDERLRRQKIEDEDFRKGCSWAIWIIGIWFVIFMANYFLKLF